MTFWERLKTKFTHNMDHELTPCLCGDVWCQNCSQCWDEDDEQVAKVPEVITHLAS